MKTRIIAHHQQVVRADREDADEIAGRPRAALLATPCGAPRAGAGAIVLSDYQKGVVTRRVMKAVLALARRRGRARCWWTPRCATSRSTAAWPW